MASPRPLRFRLAASLLAAALVVPAVTGASAQGLFDFLFGGFHNYRNQPRLPPPGAYGYAPYGDLPFYERRWPRGGSGESAHCVRLCDGSHFPIQTRTDARPERLCNALCPASKTRIFFGGEIDEAAAADGTRYSELENAFAYRQRLVPQCTCNGKDHLGLAAIDAGVDPTLRPGDLVAANRGLMAFTGKSRSGEARNFTPIEQYAGLPRDLRRRLADITVKRNR
jgi:hypothetical protein